MYNENIKRRFLEEIKSSAEKKHLVSVFNAFYPFEQKNTMDMAEMPKSVVINSLVDMQLDEVATVRNYITDGNKYIRWCRDNGCFVDARNGFTGLSVDDIDISGAIKQNFFKNEVELVNSIQSIHDLDSGYADAPILALIWVGLTMKEVRALRDSDVDLRNRVIRLPDGRAIKGFSDIIYDILYRYSICRVSSRDKGNITQEVVKDLSVDSFIKKMLSKNSKFFGKEYNEDQIRGQLDMLIGKCQQSGYTRRHTYTNVWRSGRFYELCQVEQSNVDILDFRNRPFVEEIFRNKKNYHDIKKMYHWYKKAFLSE